MGTSRTRRLATLFAVVAFSLVVVLPVSAHAASFVNEYPVTTLRTKPQVVGVTVFGATALNTTSGKITIDGVTQRTTASAVASGHWAFIETGPDANGAYTSRWAWVADTRQPNQVTLSCYPTGAALADGTHTVVATIKDRSGVLWTDTWTYTIGIPPVFGTPTPAHGSTVATATPTISVPVTDNSAGAITAVATVNGTAAAATVSGGIAAVTSPVLANDATATVTLTVTDAVGSSTSKTWSFFVQVYPEMFSTLGDCVGCHPGYENDNDMGPDCLLCHSSQVGSPHVGSPSSLHDKANVSACSPCHVSDITVEHARHLSGAGTPMTCLTCHASADPTVISTIAAGDSSCGSCHAVTSHTAAHETAVTAGCDGAECHTGTNLLPIHINTGTTLSCGSCHDSTDPLVTAAISTGDRDCTACHGSTGHAAAHETAVTVGCDGAGCHTGTNLLPIHINAGTTLSCASCHDSTDPLVAAAISTGDRDCTACHGSGGHTAAHDTTVDAGCTGSTCHSGTNLVPVHINAGTTLSCGSCHDSTDPLVVAALSTGAKDCASCHTTTPHATLHDTTVSVGCDGSSCHSGTNLVPVHINAGTTLSCASCHDSTDPLVTAAIASGDRDCTSCHGSDGHVVLHDTTVSAGCTGSTCHSGTNLTTIHTTETCASCHDSTDPLVTAAIAAGDKDCASCHTTTPHATLHDTTVDAGCTGSTCHSGTNLVPVHINAGTTLSCGSCHDSTDPLVVAALSTGAKDCASCHGAVDHVPAHETTVNATCSGADCHSGTNLTTIHINAGTPLDCWSCHRSVDPLVVAAIASGDRDCTSCHGSEAHTTVHETTMTTACAGSSCHAGSSLLTVHINAGTTLACASCHDSTDPLVVAAISGHDKACTACHDAGDPHGDGNTMHAATLTQGVFAFFAADSDHAVDMGFGEIETSATCSMCHAQTNLVGLHTQNCALCHGGATPPAETMVSWGGTCSEGACHVTYHDGASAGHDSEYIADDYGRCDSCHLVVPYGTPSPIEATTDLCGECHTLVGDPTPPTTTINALADAPYLGSQVFTLSATDINGSGVAGTYWQLDSTSGAWTSGTSVSVPAPTSGTASHTIYWYSTDVAGNVEAVKSLVVRVAPAVVKGGVIAATGEPRLFVVPAGVTVLSLDLYGGMGGGTTSYGARLVANITVTPGQTLLLKIGKRAVGATGGWGGGVGGNGTGGATGGGGSTSVGIPGDGVLAEAGGGGGSAGTSTGGPGGVYNSSATGGNYSGATDGTNTRAGGGGGWTGGAIGATANSPGGGGTSHVRNNVYTTFNASGNTTGDGRMTLNW